ncbi:MAG: hypothetical protein K2W96_23800 [Gemmataceae bacterium]|nr:hypothetical protein [Gemmataceae bacterium]
MPQLNLGTLLENIVILEATRLVLAQAPEERLLFASSFAMPPLTECWAGDGTPPADFSQGSLARLAQLPQLALGGEEDGTIRQFWALCWNNAPPRASALPICRYRKIPRNSHRRMNGGPNGALLASMLAFQQGRAMRLWVNDDTQDPRYGEESPNTPTTVSECPQTLKYAARLVGVEPPDQLADCPPWRFPHSISTPPGSLSEWLSQVGAGDGSPRIGFLDPFMYGAGDDEARVRPEDHQLWLGTLADRCNRVLSVTFSGRAHANPDPRVLAFHNDGVEQYPYSLMFSHGYFRTGVKIRWPAESIEVLTTTLQERVENVWGRWSPGHMTRLEIQRNAIIV